AQGSGPPARHDRRRPDRRDVALAPPAPARLPTSGTARLTGRLSLPATYSADQHLPLWDFGPLEMSPCAPCPLLSYAIRYLRLNKLRQLHQRLLPPHVAHLDRDHLRDPL